MDTTYFYREDTNVIYKSSADSHTLMFIKDGERSTAEYDTVHSDCEVMDEITSDDEAWEFLEKHEA